MWRFVRDLLSRPRSARTVVLLQPGVASAPRQYRVVPYHAVVATIAVAILLCCLVAAAFLFAPLRGLCGSVGNGGPCVATGETALRAAALEDSLSVQAQQLAQLRSIIVGDVSILEDSGAPAVSSGSGPAGDLASEARAATAARAGSPRAATAPADPANAGQGTEPVGTSYLASLNRPGPAPVDGIFSQGFDPAEGHFGIDIAADVGTPVHAVKDGVVVLADWTRRGGNTIAVQHPDGYLSVYKHNRRLLRGVGDWVSSRETLALSGNSGEITSGPHLHFELWQGGSPQDPTLSLILSQ